METLVVIVPGSKAKTIPLLQFLFRSFYSYFGVNTSGDHTLSEIRAYLSQRVNADVKLFMWSGGVSKILSIKPAAKKLACFIDKDKAHKKIILVGKSLGGLVCEYAIALCRHKEKISKLIYVATPHNHAKVHVPSGTKIVNVFSPEDNYVVFARTVLYRTRKPMDMIDAENISLPNVRHSEFNTNKIIQYKGKLMGLFDLYKILLTN